MPPTCGHDSSHGVGDAVRLSAERIETNQTADRNRGRETKPNRSSRKAQAAAADSIAQMLELVGRGFRLEKISFGDGFGQPADRRPRR
jgi:hypothetical protein